MRAQGFVSGEKWVAALWKTYRNNLPPPPPGFQGPATPPAETTWK
ncbi:MAG: hypothetical protein M5U26_18625 [Planctomycetota bacterium]|nr:hypothetical protein [Planctomycetota bacterium]